MNFVIHWNETAMGLHVFPIPIPPPTSLSRHFLKKPVQKQGFAALLSFTSLCKGVLRRGRSAQDREGRLLCSGCSPEFQRTPASFVINM